MGHFRKYFTDSSSISLLVSNIIVITLAIVQKWDVSTVLWVYWTQSIIIGFFQFLRILSLKNFTAFFFAFHYGFFHFIYAIFLASVAAKAPENFMFILTGSSIFFLNHLFSFIHNKEDDEKSKPNIGKLMFSPYARIIPMHLIIIFGALLGDQIKLIIFLALKTIADLAMHIFKHSKQLPFDIRNK